MMHKKYFIYTLGIILFAIATIVIINFTIDPLNYFRSNINSSYFSSERKLKARMIEENSYQGIIMGSSKVTCMSTEDLRTNDRVLNAAFSGALPEEILSFLIEKNPEITWLSIGFDWYMFNEKSFPLINKPNFSTCLSEVFPYLTSKDTFHYSFKTIKYQLRKKPPTYFGQGTTSPKREEHIEKNYDDYTFGPTLKSLENLHFKNYTISKKRLSIVEDIQKWADDHNILLIGWLNPYQKEVTELMSKELDHESLLLPSLLSSRLHHFIDLSQHYPQKEAYWKHDPFHYRPEVAKSIFNDFIYPMTLNSY